MQSMFTDLGVGGWKGGDTHNVKTLTVSCHAAGCILIFVKMNKLCRHAFAWQHRLDSHAAAQQVAMPIQYLYDLLPHMASVS